jgi:N-acetylglucosaminyl-diphospho-decaprenol L-rhamnosyltransferase
MKLLVVIVNYRSANLTVDCLRSLLPELSALSLSTDTPDSTRPVGPPLKNARVVVTDNASPDDSLEKLNAAIAANGWANDVVLQPLPKNGGFAYGNNAAIADAIASADKPQYVLLLNPDTVVRPGAVGALLDFMDQNPTAGLAGSRLEDPDGTVQRSAFRFQSVRGEIERGIRMGSVSRLLANRIVSQPPPSTVEPVPCDWVAGASLIVRREVFETAGLLDEGYFMYFEETDFCLAAKRAGWSCWYVPASRVVHLVGAVSQLSDTRKHRKRRPAYWFESRRRYFLKNHGWPYAAAADAAYLLSHAVWRFRRFVQHKEDTDPPRLGFDSLRHSVFLPATHRP